MNLRTLRMLSRPVVEILVPMPAGISFSVILGAACPKDKETAMTMRAVGKIVINVILPLPVEPVVCVHVDRHPHGYRTDKCPYYKRSAESVLTGGENNMFNLYDQFHSAIYRQEGVLGRKTKHLIAVAASLAAGCEP